MICDYFVIRRRVLIVEDLYLYPGSKVIKKEDKSADCHPERSEGPVHFASSVDVPGIRGAYEYTRGFNWLAVIALVLGAGTALVGLVVPSMRVLYSYSWFVGFAVSFVAYYALMKSRGEKLHEF
jgi:cytosine/uracil/thiamine/allantoin permease